MADLLAAVIEDLEAEHAALAAVLDRVRPEQWELPSHAPGWMVRDQVAHLAYVDELATRVMEDPEAYRAERARPREDGPSAESQFLARGRALSPEELVAWWRKASSDLIREAKGLDGKARLPWAGPDMSGVSFVTARLMETWSHGLDVVDVVKIPRPDTDRLRHIAHLGVRTRDYSYRNRGLEPNTTPVRVELTAPSGAVWVMGDAEASEVVRGSATDFCRVVTRRRHLADTHLETVGAAAAEWMELAQAFAGPPGAGRQPGEFGKESS